LHAIYELFGGKLTFFVISFVKRTQNDVRDDVMLDEKCQSKLSDVHVTGPKTRQEG